MEEYKLNDKDIRKVIYNSFSGSREETRILEEFSMGDSRADMLLVTKTKLIGLEIKSDRDSFERLARQIQDYERFFDTNYLVVGTYHVEEALRTVPAHWGIYEVYENGDGIYVMECVRGSSMTLKDNTEEKLYLLWRNELMRIVRDYRLAKGNLQRKDKMICKIVRGLSQPVIQTEICNALLAREYK
ncbi:MAG: sce7726 family protein [Lachnospiraceae bacterium]|nr:sce7726 family protein [Lachnospiraceae bacterium]